MVAQRDESARGPSSHTVEPAAVRTPPAADADLASVVRRNISALVAERKAKERELTRSERIADSVTAFTGSMVSVAFHAAVFGGWILVNAGVLPGVEPFDPFPFVMLAMWASVEAIFLTTFVLISQNRLSKTTERRADLDLQVNLLAEHEITRLIALCEAIAEKVGTRDAAGPLGELKRDVAPEMVLREIERAESRE